MEPMLTGKLDIEAKPTEVFKAIEEVKTSLGFLKDSYCLIQLILRYYSI